MPPYKAGQEIDAFCTKCKMDLLHRIVAVVSGKPVKVECRTCYTTHLYRPVKGAKAPGEIPMMAPKGAGTGTPRASRKPAAMAAPVMSSPPPGATIHPFRITERFGAGTWLQHKTFGIGVVLREVPPDKIEVRFDDASRMLVHGRAP